MGCCLALFRSKKQEKTSKKSMNAEEKYKDKSQTLSEQKGTSSES